MRMSQRKRNPVGKSGWIGIPAQRKIKIGIKKLNSTEKNFFSLISSIKIIKLREFSLANIT